jgi:dTDP-glucose pyrophosphorylase
MVRTDNVPWRECLLPTTCVLKAAVECLDRTGLQIAIVTDDESRMVGTITDGDIRRGLLRGLSMSSSIEEIIQRSPVVVPPELNREAVHQLMRANRIHQLPVVDDERKVVGLHLWEMLRFPEARPNLFVIMAGGKGTRLRPYTQNCPKPLVPINGKPMLEHIIERAHAEGFSNFVIAVHHLGHMIEEYFEDGAQWGVSIEYLREESPLGTGGALSLLPGPLTAPIVVTNGDVISDIHYSEILDFHTRHNAAATMAIRSHEWHHPFGVVKTDGVRLIGFEEKPIYRSHVNAGIYVLDPDILTLLDDNQYCDMPTLFERSKQESDRVIVYPMHEPWLDVGRPADLELAQNHASLEADAIYQGVS